MGLEEWLSQEWKMVCLEVQFWARIEKEIYEPLNNFRKAATVKFQTLNDTVSNRYDRILSSNSNRWFYTFYWHLF